MRARRAGLLTILALAPCLAACVTEPVRPTRGMPVKPREGGTSSSTPAESLPPGPIAEPARGATTNTRVQIAVVPLGSVAYDGQVLPLVAPDGRFIVVQEGDAPSWPAMLATPDASPPQGVRLRVYEVSSTGIQPVEHARALPEATLLGRAADSRGFLVEHLEPDGARWIGRVAWVSGELEWLVTGTSVNAHATLTRDGDLLFTRRRADGVDDLVLRLADGREATTSARSGSYAFPMTTLDPATVYALVRRADTVELEALRVVRDSAGGATSLGQTIARRAVARGTAPALAYQIAAPSPAAAPVLRPRDEPGAATDGAVLFHPGVGRMVLFDARAGEFLLLSPESVAAARWSAGDTEGYLCTTNAGLLFTVRPGPVGIIRRPDARVLGGPYVARPTAGPEGVVLLFGPDAARPDRLTVLAMKLANSSGAPEAGR